MEKNDLNIEYSDSNSFLQRTYTQYMRNDSRLTQVLEHIKNQIRTNLLYFDNMRTDTAASATELNEPTFNRN